MGCPFKRVGCSENCKNAAICSGWMKKLDLNVILCNANPLEDSWDYDTTYGQKHPDPSNNDSPSSLSLLYI